MMYGPGFFGITGSTTVSEKRDPRSASDGLYELYAIAARTVTWPVAMRLTEADAEILISQCRREHLLYMAMVTDNEPCGWEMALRPSGPLVCARLRPCPVHGTKPSTAEERAAFLHAMQDRGYRYGEGSVRYNWIRFPEDPREGGHVGYLDPNWVSGIATAATKEHP